MQQTMVTRQQKTKCNNNLHK